MVVIAGDRRSPNIKRVVMSIGTGAAAGVESGMQSGTYDL